MKFLQGKKTFILAALGVVYAISAYFTGHLSFNEAVQVVLTSGIGTTLKLGQLGK